MKFYSGMEGNLSVRVGDSILTFKCGVLETENPDHIKVLKERYQHDKQEENQTDYEAMTVKELVKLLVEAGVSFDKRQRKEELIALLRKEG